MLTVVWFQKLQVAFRERPPTNRSLLAFKDMWGMGDIGNQPIIWGG